MPSTLPRPVLLLAGALTLVSACSRATHYDDLGPISGSTGALQPRISSASTMTGPQVVVEFTIPERSYVSVVQVSTQASVSILGAPSAGAPTALERLDAGPHKILLSTTPVYVVSNRGRLVRAASNRDDPRLAPTDTRYAVHQYTVVVATARPMSVADLRESLADVDLVGPDDAVLQRVAEAVGAHSLGAWGASAARTALSSAPF
jgi:hypothetical protein